MRHIIIYILFKKEHSIIYTVMLFLLCMYEHLRLIFICVQDYYICNFILFFKIIWTMLLQCQTRLSYEKGFSQFEKEIEEIKWTFRPLNYKLRVIFKLKRNKENVIDGWDIKIEEKQIERIYSPILPVCETNKKFSMIENMRTKWVLEVLVGGPSHDKIC
jgi:hypothetical protein